jgi:hypothetical protein
MSLDEEGQAERMEQRINLRHFASLFRGRRDAFGLMRGGKIAAVRRPVSLFHYRLHLEGKIRLGIYPLLSDGRTFFLALDFDGPDAWDSARRVFLRARHFQLPFVWEVSKSGDVHLWIFFSEPVAARGVRRVAGMLLEESSVSAEIFPKQDTLPESGLGNFIWLPLSGTSVEEGRTLFVDPATRQPYRDPWGFLVQIPRVSAATIAGIVEVNGLNGPGPPDPSYTETRTYSGGLLPCARKMLEGVSEGCRDVVAFRLAVHLKANGYPFQEAERSLQEWNAERNRPPLTSREITVKVRSAYQHGYSGYGCEDPLIIPFCDEACPVKQKALAVQFAAEEGCQ